MKSLFRLWLPIIAVVGGAVWLAWIAAGPGAMNPPPAPGTGTDPAITKSKSNKSAPKAGEWQPPEGDPVERYKAPGQTAQQRKDLISNFMALGHPNNPFMLIAALNDSDPGVRFFAVESASALVPEEAREVYRRAAISEDPDVREMTWSLSAPHPIENRVYIYSDALERAGDKALEEVLAEMGRTPERPLFEMMLSQAMQIKDNTRVARLQKELQEWLVPGGGEVPQFKTVQDMATWWQKTHPVYDEFMLRTDQ